MDDNKSLVPVIDRLVASGKVELVGISGTGVSAHVAAVPKNADLKSIKGLLDEYRTQPERRVGTDRLDDLESLIKWTNRHRDTGSVLFCDARRDAPKLLSLIDYHHEVVKTEGSTPGNGDSTARFRNFRGLYEFPLDRRWKAWNEKNDKPMSQADFAEFLEDHVLDLHSVRQVDGEGKDVMAPPEIVTQYLALMGGRVAEPADVVNLSRGLKINVRNKIKNEVNVQSGEGGIVFESAHEGQNGEKVDVPRLFMVAIPVFDKADTFYRLPVRIRYRPTPGGIVWILSLYGHEEIVDKAIADAAKKAAAETTLPLINGWPS